ncbi:tail tubular protein A [Rhizobium phage RHph_I20]|uniref:Tail tubular protein A n=1 Tax=Rhizobium phage RHph_I20 TaxID=2509730 RepID=A0A7S5RBG9_9CAUD|nr:tail tubular protein A [Rhizobium phage RHph_I20]
MLTFNPLLPTNTLEAVNLALSYMREPPVDDLALINTSFPVMTAYANLMQQTRFEQVRGWFFNTPTKTFTPNAEGRIVFETNVIDVQPDRDDISPQETVPILSGSKLINAYDGSDVWTKPLKLKTVVLVSFEAMPEAFKIYVAIKNAALCGMQVSEDIALSEYHQREFLRAEAERTELELRANPVNFFSTIPGPR